MNAMHSIAKVTGRVVATTFDLSSYKTACDLGGRNRILEGFHREPNLTVTHANVDILNCTREDGYGKLFYQPTNFVTLERTVIPVLFGFLYLGCTGAMAYEFARAYPELSVTVLDLPAVIEMSGHFRPHNAEDRVSFVAGLFIYRGWTN